MDKINPLKEIIYLVEFFILYWVKLFSYELYTSIDKHELFPLGNRQSYLRMTCYHKENMVSNTIYILELEVGSPINENVFTSFLADTEEFSVESAPVAKHSRRKA
ncbi:hypothetical protein BDF21DRAFT_397573 [Thamnidium elegans]|nr:hypothetical protein BDF21DRAFT_397573 [Thamnidium elegans]